MASRALAVLLIASFAVAALAQAPLTCDGAKQLGKPGNNQCGRLCTTVAQRNKELASLLNYCQKQCELCVGEAQGCAKGAGLPKTCQQATKYPQVLKVINECVALQQKGKSC